MSIGIFGTLQIAKESLFTNQNSIAVTSNNISNVNTPGYSRQQAVIETWDSQKIGGLVFGRGSKITDITKSYDQFLNNNIAIEKSILGMWEAKESSLTELETVFNESNGNGINELLNDFWNAWNDVADSTESLPERAVLQADGISLCSKFNSMIYDLKSIQTDANTRIANVLETINTLTKEIAEINAQVLSAESQGGSANSLTNARSLKVEELSTLIDIQVLTQNNNQLTILTVSGQPLVADNESWDLKAEINPDNSNFYDIMHVDGNTRRDLTDRISGGQLKGLLTIRDETVPEYIEKLDFMAASLISEVNKIHYDGYGLDGSTGNLFFTPNSVSLEAGDSNNGGANIFDAQIDDPAGILASNFELKFLSSTPQDTKYEIYDELNDQYLYNIDAGNATLVFNELGTDKLIAIDHGTYTGAQLAAEIEKEMDAIATNSIAAKMDYSVTYDETNRSFTIKNLGDNPATIEFSDIDSTIAQILGFDPTDIILNPIETAESNVKAGVYTYAAQLMEIDSGVNDTIVFEVGGGGNQLAILTAGVYTPSELAAEIEYQLEQETGDDFNVQFSTASQRFIITNNTTANIEYKLSQSSAASTLNFDPVDTGVLAAGTTIQSDDPRYAERLFDIITGTNDEIRFSDGGVDTINDIVAVIPEGKYTGEQLAAEIENQLEATSGSSGQDYLVTFDSSNGQFRIINDAANQHSLDISWSSTPNTAATLGFNAVDQSIAAGSATQSVSIAGIVVSYDTISIYGISFKLADQTALPQRGDTFHISTIKDAALNMTMDDVTATNTDKIAAALSAIDIDGSNNTIIYDDDGDLSDNRDADGNLIEGNYKKIVIPSGRYTPEELADIIEDLLEQNSPGSSYAVEYDRDSSKFSFISNPSNVNPVTFLWETEETTAAFSLGFSSEIFSISENINDQFSFLEGSYGDPNPPVNDPNWGAATSFHITLAPGTYTGEQMAEHIQDKMNAIASQYYSVTYDTDTRQFTITNTAENPDINTVLDWSGMTETARTLGFNSADSDYIPANTTNASTTSDFTPGQLTASADPSSLIETSDFTVATAEVGDNRNAINITDIRDREVLSNNTLTFDAYYSIVTGDVGTEVAEAQRGAEHQDYMVSQYEERRSSIAGVSLDEEMINLIKFQQAYSISAKLISTLDEMMNTLISI